MFIFLIIPEEICHLSVIFSRGKRGDGKLERSGSKSFKT
jgi:hypothetical protein